MVSWEEWKRQYEKLFKEDFKDDNWTLDAEGEANIKKFYYDEGDSPEEAFKLESGCVGWICIPNKNKEYV